MSKGAAQEERALEVVRDYMLRQNRPYSAQDVVLNLHKEFGKTLVVKVLDGLVDAGDLKEKTLSKQKIYYPNQDNFPSFDESELKTLDAEIQRMSEEVKALTEKKRELEASLRSLEASLQTEQLRIRMEELRKECLTLETKKKNLQNSGEKVDPQDKKTAMDNKQKYVRVWRKRKRIAEDILNTILENCPKKKRDLVEEIGVEIDEDSCLNLP